MKQFLILAGASIAMSLAAPAGAKDPPFKTKIPPLALIPDMTVTFEKYISGGKSQGVTSKVVSPVKLTTKEGYFIVAKVPYEPSFRGAKGLSVAFKGVSVCFHDDGKGTISSASHSVGQASIHGKAIPLTGQTAKILILKFRVDALNFGCKVPVVGEPRPDWFFGSVNVIATITALATNGFRAVRETQFLIQ